MIVVSPVKHQGYYDQQGSHHYFDPEYHAGLGRCLPCERLSETAVPERKAAPWWAVGLLIGIPFLAWAGWAMMQ